MPAAHRPTTLVLPPAAVWLEKPPRGLPAPCPVRVWPAQPDAAERMLARRCSDRRSTGSIAFVYWVARWSPVPRTDPTRYRRWPTTRPRAGLSRPRCPSQVLAVLTPAVQGRVAALTFLALRCDRVRARRCFQATSRRCCTPISRSGQRSHPSRRDSLGSPAEAFCVWKASGIGRVLKDQRASDEDLPVYGDGCCRSLGARSWSSMHSRASTRPKGTR